MTRSAAEAVALLLRCLSTAENVPHPDIARVLSQTHQSPVCCEVIVHLCT